MSEADLSRREFLEKTAYTAGLAGMAGTVPIASLMSEAAEAQARRARLPSPRNVEIDHFVVLMMENRSFDHYFGWLGADADARQQLSYRNEQGQSVPTRHHSTLGSGGMEWKGCGHPDPGHGWESGRAQLNGGFLAKGADTDEFALTYFNRGELAFIHAAAQNYTSFDRWFCSILASTYPNRHYKWGAQCGGNKNNRIPADSAGEQWETIFDRALGRGLSARYYNSDLPFSALYGPRGAAWTNPISRYYQDCAQGTLPNISFVDPPFKDGGGGDGLSADEHPLGDVRLGQAFMADAVNAFVRSPNYRRVQAVVARASSHLVHAAPAAHGVITPGAGHPVVARPPVHPVTVGASVQAVLAGFAPHDVATPAARHAVVPAAAEEPVAAPAPGDPVLARPAADHVGASGAVQPVGALGALDGLGGGRRHRGQQAERREQRERSDRAHRRQPIRRRAGRVPVV